MTDPARRTLQRSPLGSPAQPDTSARAIRDMFAAVAPRYDFLNHLLSFGRDLAWRKGTARALREVLSRPDSLAVDVCCGTGDLALELGRLSAGKVIGTDFCRPMLQRAREKAARRLRPVFFLEADTLALPFRDGSLDLVSVAFGFRNLADHAHGLQEMRRVLKPGGVVAILEFSQVHWSLLGLSLIHI